MLRKSACFVLAALSLAACGKTPTQPARPLRDLDTPAYTAPAAAPVTQAPAAMPGADPRVQAALAATQHLRDTSSTADIMLMCRYVKDDGTKAWIRSHYKYQKPRHNSVELLSGSDSKVEGTQLIWTGGGKVQVRTKFVGFWLNISLDLADDRLKDPAGYRLDQTAIDKVFDTLLWPQNQVSFLADGNQNGRPMTVLSVVSPLRLAPATREVFGVEKGTGVPLLHEMYKGDKLYFRSEVESNKANPKLTSADFELK